MKSLGEDPHALDVVGKPKDLQLIWCRDQVGDAQGRSREVEHRLERFRSPSSVPRNGTRSIRCLTGKPQLTHTISSVLTKSTADVTVREVVFRDVGKPLPSPVGQHA